MDFIDFHTHPYRPDDLTPGTRDFVFRTCFIDPFQGQVMSKFAMDTLKAKNAAVLYDNANDYSKGLAQVFKDSFEKAGGKPVGYVLFVGLGVDFGIQFSVRYRSERFKNDDMAQALATISR